MGYSQKEHFEDFKVTVFSIKECEPSCVIKSPHDWEVLQRQIDANDKQIDRLVYELYDLMPSSDRQGGAVQDTISFLKDVIISR